MSPEYLKTMLFQEKIPQEPYADGQPVVPTENNLAKGSRDSLTPGYKCCCGCLHVCTGAIIIGILELVGVFANAVGLILNYKNGDFDTNTKKLVGGLTGAVVTTVVVMLMFHGMWKEKHRFVVPHLVFQAIGVAALFVGGVVALVEFLEGKNAAIMASASETSSTSAGTVSMATVATSSEGVNLTGGESFLLYTLATIVVLIVSSIVEIWFFSVIYRFYRYLKEKQQQQHESQHLVVI